MNQTEVWVYLHSISHGITTVSAGDTLGFRQMLPTHLIEFVPDPNTPRKGLIRMPSWLAQAHGLMPKPKSITSSGLIGGTADKPSQREVDERMAFATSDSLSRALDGERQRAAETRVPKFRPARDSYGNEAGGLLSSHRARSQVEQLASELGPTESFPYNSAGE